MNKGSGITSSSQLGAGGGGGGGIAEQQTFYTALAQTNYVMSQTLGTNYSVYVDGIIIPPADYSDDGDKTVILTRPEGSQIIIIIYG